MKKIGFLYRCLNKFKIQKNNCIEIGNNVGLSGCTIIIKGQNNILSIDEDSRLRNLTIEIVGNDCSIKIGKKCVIGKGCYLSAKEENISINIDDHCMFSRNVNILTSDGHPIFHNEIRINPPQSIFIGKKVWLADNVTILKGVNIGENSVVGIHSLVTKSISSNSISVGIPAKVIKEHITWKV